MIRSGGAILPTCDAVFRFNEMHAAHPGRLGKHTVTIKFFF